MEREEIQQELAATNQFCELKVKEKIKSKPTTI